MEVTTQKKKDAYASKHHRFPESIQVPDAIVDCDQLLLREYWSVKRGKNALRTRLEPPLQQAWTKPGPLRDLVRA